VPQRETLGQILMDLGRLTREDVEKALAHQREQGGRFGEALVALGILSQEEIEWGLASQHDLPYVFPDAAAIDIDAARLVSPEWALAHMSLPMMRSGDLLTVLVDSPFRIEAVRGVAERAGCEVQLALAAPARIRDVIRQVYAREMEREETGPTLPVSLEEGLAHIAASEAVRFGLTIRGSRTGLWWDDGGTIRRRVLDARWGSVLADRMQPRLEEAGEDPFEALLDLDGPAVPVEVRWIEGQGGREILFRRLEDPGAPAVRFTPPPAGVLAEVRLLARSGAARFVVTGEPSTVAREILPHLPGFFFERDRRSVHLHDGSGEGGPGLGIRLPHDPEERVLRIDALRPFHFDIVTVALERLDATSLSRALDTAAACFLLGLRPEDTTVARQAGVRWRLHLVRSAGGHLDWTLESIGR
jgi:type IV pilus assembly protein PilB